jgi:hypothetical protein
LGCCFAIFKFLVTTHMENPIGSLTIHEWVDEAQRWEDLMAYFRANLIRFLTQERECWSFGIIGVEEVQCCAAQSNTHNVTHYKHQTLLVDVGQKALIARVIFRLMGGRRQHYQMERHRLLPRCIARISSSNLTFERPSAATMLMLYVPHPPCTITLLA